MSVSSKGTSNYPIGLAKGYMRSKNVKRVKHV
jgi:hypothetical protein